MLVNVLKSKIHAARVTDSNLEYEGSLGIPEDLMDLSGLRENERIDVYNITNGNRFSTYVIKESKGDFVVNGAAAHLASKGDKIIIASYALIEQRELGDFKPRVIRLDLDNKPIG